MTPPILGIWASQISGHLWAPAGAYDALATITVPSGGASSITFAGIPTGYKHLQLRLFYFLSGNIGLRFNNDSSGAYTYHRLGGTGSSAYAGGSSATGRTMATFGTAGGTASTTPSACIVDILDYTSTSKTKTIRALNGNDNNTSGNIQLYSNLWTATPASVNQITLLEEGGGSFAQYTVAALYGIK